MSTNTDELAGAVAQEFSNELEDALKKINHCADQLSDDQLWWRPAESMNSIANLMLHLCGNMRQWIVSGVGGDPDVRRRPEEFSERGPIGRQELVRNLNGVVAAAKAALSKVTAEELLRVRRIQGFEVSGLRAIVESVAHFRGHTQEIVHMTRCQLGNDYKFDFVPSTPEQGAPVA